PLEVTGGDPVEALDAHGGQREPALAGQRGVHLDEGPARGGVTAPDAPFPVLLEQRDLQRAEERGLAAARRAEHGDARLAAEGRPLRAGLRVVPAEAGHVALPLVDERERYGLRGLTQAE